MFQSLKQVPAESILSYKAAGIVPFHSSVSSSATGISDDGWFLLGRDTRRRSKASARVWCDFGGKIDRKTDLSDPWMTALREFGEETAGALNGWIPSPVDVRVVVWNSAGKYLLFVTNSPPFNVSNCSLSLAPEKDALAWVRGEDLIGRALALPSVAPIAAHFEPNTSSVMNHVSVVAFPFFLYSFRIMADAMAKSKQ